MLEPGMQGEVIVALSVGAAWDLVALVVGLTAYCLPDRKIIHKIVYPGLIFFIALWVPFTREVISILGSVDTKSPKILSLFIISLVYVVFYIHREIQSVSSSPIQRPRNLRVIVGLGRFLLLVDCVGGVLECVGMVWGGSGQNRLNKSGRVMTIAGSTLSLLIFLGEIGLISWMREICDRHQLLEGNGVEATNLRRSHHVSKSLAVPAGLTMGRLIWRVVDAIITYGNKHPHWALSYIFDLYFPIIVATWVPVATCWEENGLASDAEGAETTQEELGTAGFGGRQESAR